MPPLITDACGVCVSVCVRGHVCVCVCGHVCAWPCVFVSVCVCASGRAWLVTAGLVAIAIAFIVPPILRSYSLFRCAAVARAAADGSGSTQQERPTWAQLLLPSRGLEGLPEGQAAVIHTAYSWRVWSNDYVQVTVAVVGVAVLLYVFAGLAGA